MIRIRQSDYVYNYHIKPFIKPCPSCYSDWTVLELWGVDDHYEVRCRVCGLDGPHGDNEQAAIAVWNSIQPQTIRINGEL